MDFGIIINELMDIGFNEWNALIDKCDFLEAMPDKQSVDPFTNEPIILYGESKAYYVEDDELVGKISLEGGKLLTTKVPESVCVKLATKLESSFYVDERIE